MKIEAGSYWVCSPKFDTNIPAVSVFCKVLFVGEHDVYLARTSQYGFTPLSPKSMKFEDFLEVYRPIEEYGYTGRS